MVQNTESEKDLFYGPTTRTVYTIDKLKQFINTSSLNTELDTSAIVTRLSNVVKPDLIKQLIERTGEAVRDDDRRNLADMVCEDIKRLAYRDNLNPRDIAMSNTISNEDKGKEDECNERYEVARRKHQHADIPNRPPAIDNLTSIITHKTTSTHVSHEEFVVLCNEIIEHCKQTLEQKGKGYATDKNRLHNFNRCASITSLSPLQSLFFMHIKHWVKYYDWLSGDVPMPDNMEDIDEVIGDIINYAIIARVMIKTEKFGHLTSPL